LHSSDRTSHILDAPNHPPPHDHRRFRVFSHGIPENHSPRQGLESGATTLAVKSLRGIVQGARFALWDSTSQAFSFYGKPDHHCRCDREPATLRMFAQVHSLLLLLIKTTAQTKSFWT